MKLDLKIRAQEMTKAATVRPQILAKRRSEVSEEESVDMSESLRSVNGIDLLCIQNKGLVPPTHFAHTQLNLSRKINGLMTKK